MGRQIAVALLPYAQELLDWLVSAIKWFNDLPEPMRKTVTLVAALGGGLSLVAGPMGLIISYLPAIKAGLATLSGAFTPFLVGGAIVVGLTAIATLFLTMKENARLAKLEIASISELAEAEKVRAYWEGEVRRQEARQKAAEEMAKLAASGVVGPGRAGQAFAMVPEFDPAALENAKEMLDEATARVKKLKKTAEDAAGGDGGDGGFGALTQAEKTAYELAREKFERTVFYEDLLLEEQMELWRTSVAIYAKSVEERFDSDKALASMRKELEESTGRTEEENRQKRLTSAEAWIAHEVAMNRMNTDEQIKAYRRILDNYTLTAEEKTRIRRQVETLEQQAREKDLQDEIDKSQKALDLARNRIELVKQGMVAPTSIAELKMFDAEVVARAGKDELAKIEQVIAIARQRVQAVMEGKAGGEIPWADLRLWDEATLEEGLEAGRKAVEDQTDNEETRLLAIIRNARLRIEAVLSGKAQVTSEADLKMLDEATLKEGLEAGRNAVKEQTDKEEEEIRRTIGLSRQRVQAVMEGKAGGEIPWADLKLWDEATLEEGLEAGRNKVKEQTDNEERELGAMVTVARQRIQAILAGKAEVTSMADLKMLDEATLKEGLEAGQKAVKEQTDKEERELQQQINLSRQRIQAVMEGKAEGAEVPWADLKMWDEATLQEGLEAGRNAVKEQTEREEAELQRRLDLSRQRIDAILEGKAEPVDWAQLKMLDEATLKEGLEAGKKAVEDQVEREAEELERQVALARQRSEAILSGKAAPESLAHFRLVEQAGIAEGLEAAKNVAEEIRRYEEALFEFRRRIGQVTLDEELGRAYAALEAAKSNTEERVRALERVHDLERRAISERYGLERDLTEWQKQETIKRLQAELAALDTSVEANRGRVEAIEGILADLSATMPTLEQQTASWGQTLIDGLSRAIAYGEDLGDVFRSLLQQIAEWFIKYRILMPLLGPLFGTATPVLGFAGAGGTLHLTLHQGGEITETLASYMRSLAPPIYAHQGLRVDEVPIIAQTGERVLSRQQNEAFEKLLAEPRQVQVQMHVQAVDAASFAALAQRHPEAISTVVIQEIQRNGAIRRVLMGR